MRVLEAVVEDDDDSRAETPHTEQLGASSWGKTLRQGTRDVLTADQHETGKTNKCPPDASTAQSTLACLRRKVPADHAAHSQTQW